MKYIGILIAIILDSCFGDYIDDVILAIVLAIGIVLLVLFILFFLFAALISLLSYNDNRIRIRQCYDFCTYQVNINSDNIEHIKQSYRYIASVIYHCYNRGLDKDGNILGDTSKFTKDDLCVFETFKSLHDKLEQYQKENYDNKLNPFLFSPFTNPNSSQNSDATTHVINANSKEALRGTYTDTK